MIFSKKYFFTLLFICAIFFFAQAQSINFIHPQPLWNKHAPTISMSEIPLEKLQYEDELNRNNKNIPWRFAYEFESNITSQNAGAWQILDDGTKIWQLKISSPNAQSLNFVFENFNLPKDAYIVIYNNKNKTLINPYNASNNNVEHILGTTLIIGDEAIIEYVEPANAEFKGTFSLSKIFHGYRTFEIKSLLTGFGSSGSCENNVNCPIGNGWQKEKRSVCVVITGGGFCSGSLLNDVAQDTTPFLMTAHHCGSAGFASWVFMFNYESPNCTNINGSQNQTVTGATLLATNTKSDFTLLKLNSKVPLGYHPYFAGWNNTNNFPDSVVGIHHPEGDIKKISFAYNQCYDSSYTDSYTALCWNIKHWDNGVTEPGSSGSPLYNKYHQFVGQLFGGPSFCGCNDTDKNDYYGKFSTTWNADTAIHAQAKFWIDPQNTGATSIAGFDPFPPTIKIDTPVATINYGVFPNPTNDKLTIRTDKQSAISKIILYDKLGNLILNNTYNSSETEEEISLKNYMGGIYFVQIIDTNGNVVLKKVMRE